MEGREEVVTWKTMMWITDLFSLVSAQVLTDCYRVWSVLKLNWLNTGQ